MTEPATNPEDEIRDFLARDLAEGFNDPADIAESALDYFGDEIDAKIAGPIVERLLPELIRAQLAAQSSWPAVTDCDKLDAAFAELTNAGIVARQDFTCCGNCGVAEIGAEIETEAASGIVPRGYTFYHQQSTEAAVEGCGLMLSYGAMEAGDAKAVAIGHEIVATLVRHGLPCDWNGTIERCIGVPLVWQRRLVLEAD